MDRNILKLLHNDLRKLIIEKYLHVYNNLSISEVHIDNKITTIEYHILDKNGNYLESETIEFSNNKWIY